MNVEEESKQFQLDWLKWLVAVVLLGGAIYANWYYGAESALYRALGMIAAVLVVGFIAAQTEKGAAVVELAMGARTELRKVVWPTRNQLTTYTAVVLVFVTFIIAVVSLIDLVLGRLVFWVFG